ncbi:MAG: SOS response-associated peptidase family protein [Bdellovibrionaceae bacterium]|nr:SOS response-associated peptidase family protein [Bdellovibrionales bacterium]MCB9085958.1 SOS response-associated peptidase family protein [Pseudobdellovibrionaceae bacterium]
MCAQFMLKTDRNEVETIFEVSIPVDLPDALFDQRVVPFRYAPVIVAEEGRRVVRAMRFHLTPRWAKTETVKWATYNARLDSILEKASFRLAFRENRCLVLMNQFVEPIYEGKWAGHMVRFHEKESSVLAAAGIFDEWVHPETGEVIESFAVVTNEPSEFVERIGHDRQPVFPADGVWDEWLKPGKADGLILQKLLIDNPQQLEFAVSEDRPMRPGWEKRK